MAGQSLFQLEGRARNVHLRRPRCQRCSVNLCSRSNDDAAAAAVFAAGPAPALEPPECTCFATPACAAFSFA